MANKANQFYFDNFIAASEQATKAASFLTECLKDFDPNALGTRIAELHAIEHKGDAIKHEMSAALAKAFITPVDREDLAGISEDIDNVTDCIEEVLQRFYVDEIKAILPEAIDFCEKLCQCCNLMTAMLREFVNFKKPAKLHEMIVELNRTEEECDELYLRSVLAVRKHCTETLDIIFWREIYDCLENCADACEHVGDCVERVVMKNT